MAAAGIQKGVNAKPALSFIPMLSRSIAASSKLPQKRAITQSKARIRLRAKSGRVGSTITDELVAKEEPSR